jgi:cysteinyl-tRNA synthetase
VRYTEAEIQKTHAMSLRLHNTLSRTKEDFVPLDPQNVRMYVCGPTVYDYAHIGNARPAIVFDVLFRLLRHLYGESHVTYVRNITDIDDKINARALELQDERDTPILDIVRELTQGTAKIYEDDMAALGCLPPTREPRATQHIPQMIAMIKSLIKAGHAYAAQGHVLFDVSSKADYGKLAKRSLDDMIAGARVDVAPYKKSPMDFVLWKPSDAQTPGWDSPWGFGRPGWHLECSAMSAEYLGETFDIHGGGIDLVFPHHENEVAQSEGAHHNHPIARYWLHNGHLQVEGAKMSKSLGNFVTVHDLLTKLGMGPRSGDAIRLAMLMTHYRQPMDWTHTKLLQAGINLHSWHDVIMSGVECSPEADIAEVDAVRSGKPSAELLSLLCDDLNTAEAVNSHLFSLVNQAKAGGADGARFAIQLAIDCLLMGFDPFRYYRSQLAALPVEQEILAAIDVRAAAKKAKNFAEADRIRDELDAKGIVLKDSKDGTTWEVKR